MCPSINPINLPYDSVAGNSFANRLIDHLSSGQWTRFSVAVAFARNSGNFVELIASLNHFAHQGNKVRMTFGADVFNGTDSGSDFSAIEGLVKTLDGTPDGELWLHSSSSSVFHPKIYIFSNAHDLPPSNVSI